VPADGVRPTKDRVKAAVFSALDARGLLDGAVVLDLFAGCGALGLEALSRGAAEAVFVERDPAALSALRANVQALGWADRAKVQAGAAERFAAATADGGRSSFDLAFVDPPYDMAATDVGGVLERLAARVPGGTMVVERPARGEPPPAPEGWSVTWERTFGDTLVTFVQPAATPPAGSTAS
jgi:16S rRNA (guanine966-N2)-methyltransferase